MTTSGKATTETIVAANDFRVAGALNKVVNAAGDFTLINDAYAIGLALSQPNSGQHLTVGLDGVMKAYIGGAITSAGTILSVAASGFLVAAGSGDIGVGRTLALGASGDLVRCQLDFARSSLVS